MLRLVAGEFHKLFTTRLWLWLLAVAAALTVLYVSVALAFADHPDTWVPPLATPEGQQTLFAVGQNGARTVVAVLAAIGITGEFRHRTATGTFLGTPHRGRVVTAKLACYLLVGAGYALVCVAVTAAVALPWLAGKGVGVSLLGGGVLATVAGGVVAVAVFGLLGVGVGALLRDQVATVVTLLFYLFVAEPVLAGVPAWQGWTVYLPGPAATALTQLALTGQQVLPSWQGGLVLACYGAAFAVAGTLLAVRRDVT